MPDLYVQVNACDPEIGNTGRVVLSFEACGSDGNKCQGTVPVQFLSSTAQMNLVIIEAAKATYSQNFGVIFGTGDQVKLGGAIV